MVIERKVKTGDLAWVVQKAHRRWPTVSCERGFVVLQVGTSAVELVVESEEVLGR